MAKQVCKGRKIFKIGSKLAFVQMVSIRCSKTLPVNGLQVAFNICFAILSLLILSLCFMVLMNIGQ
jgi:hypothetical protein